MVVSELSLLSDLGSNINGLVSMSLALVKVSDAALMRNICLHSDNVISQGAITMNIKSIIGSSVADFTNWIIITS